MSLLNRFMILAISACLLKVLADPLLLMLDWSAFASSIFFLGVGCANCRCHSNWD